jgi:hypothetical protein
MHRDAINVENKINDNVRVPGVEKARVGDVTYTKAFIEKPGITIETITTDTSNMQIEKRTIQLSINKPPQ